MGALCSSAKPSPVVHKSSPAQKSPKRAPAAPRQVMNAGKAFKQQYPDPSHLKMDDFDSDSGFASYHGPVGPKSDKGDDSGFASYHGPVGPKSDKGDDSGLASYHGPV